MLKDFQGSFRCKTQMHIFFWIKKWLKAIVHNRWCALQGALIEGLFYAGLPSSQLMTQDPVTPVDSNPKICSATTSGSQKWPHVVDIMSSLMPKIDWYPLCKKCKLSLSSCFIQSRWTVTDRKMLHWKTSSSVIGLKIMANLAEWNSFKAPSCCEWHHHSNKLLSLNSVQNVLDTRLFNGAVTLIIALPLFQRLKWKYWILFDYISCYLIDVVTEGANI